MSANIASRQDTEALIREQVISTIFRDAPKRSTFMGVAHKLPNMISKQARIHVLDFLSTAYWVNGDTGMKQAARQVWDNVYLTADELAATASIPEAVLDDAEFDVMGEITPRVNEAIEQCVDSAIIFGHNHPAEWQSNIITLVRQVGGNVADIGDEDLYDKLLGKGGVLFKVEENSYMISDCLSTLGMRAKLRGLRAADGTLIFKSGTQGLTPYTLGEVPMYSPMNNSYDKNIAQLVVDDFKQMVYAIRQGIVIKTLDQGVTRDPVTREIVYNLAQQDTAALRVVFRMGWALPDTTTRLGENHTGCAFAYLESVTPYTARKMIFTVENGNDEDVSLVEKARVSVNDAKLMTGADGTVEFNLRKGTYPVKITKRDHTTINDTVVVTEDTVAENITLIKNRQEGEASPFSLRRC